MKNTIELKWQADWLLGVEGLDTIHQGMIGLINDLDGLTPEIDKSFPSTFSEPENTVPEQEYQQVNEKIDGSFLPLLQDLNECLMQFIHTLDAKDTRVRGRHYKTYKQGILSVLDELIRYVRKVRINQLVDGCCMSEIKYRFGLHMRSIAIFMRIYNAADPREVTYLSARQ